MQNFRKKVRSLMEAIPAVKIAACMLSVAMAAVIFWGFTLTGNTDTTVQELTVAESIRAAGDTLTASADPTKFTGVSKKAVLSNIFLSASGQSPIMNEAENKMVPEEVSEEPQTEEEKVFGIDKGIFGDRKRDCHKRRSDCSFGRGEKDFSVKAGKEKGDPSRSRWQKNGNL